MSSRSAKKPASIPGDLIVLAFLNGLSTLALNGAAVFGMLAVLSGGYFLHGLTGLGFYVFGGALATFIGYAGTCLYAARLGLKYHTALYAVFLVHAVGFIAAAAVHPVFVALSAGLSLGIFFAIFMLKNINDIADPARDRYATLSGVIQQGVALIAPILGSAALYAGTKAGFDDPFFPAFLSFAFCALASIPLIHRMPNRPLPHSVKMRFRKVFEGGHLAAGMLVLSTIICDSLMNPLLIISSFALLGKPVDVGWFTAAVAVLALISLFVSQRMRLIGKRWVIMAASLLSIGIGFGIADTAFSFLALLFAGAVYAVARANYAAAYYPIYLRVMEHEWGQFGKNGALVLGEMFVLLGRTLNAGMLLACGVFALTLRQSLGIIVVLYLISAVTSSLLARHFDRRHKAQVGSLTAR